MRLVTRVIQKFHLELPLRSLFQSPTVASVAAVIRERQKKQLGEEDLQRMLGEIDVLSDEEVRRLLIEETTTKSESDRHE